MAAESRLLETWKSINVPGHPFQNSLKKKISVSGRETRSTERGDLAECGPTKCFWSQAARLWNNSNVMIKSAKTISQAKREIKKIVKLLPI